MTGKQMTEILNGPPSKGCPKCGQLQESFASEGKRRGHVRFCKGQTLKLKPPVQEPVTTPDVLNQVLNQRVCRFCGRNFHKQGIAAHIKSCKDGGAYKSRRKETANCPQCGRIFNVMGLPTHLKHCKGSLEEKTAKTASAKIGQRRGACPHLILPDKDFTEKDRIRETLQGLAMLYLDGHMPKNAQAICLPGLRPDRERELLRGFNVTMVEINGKVHANDPTIIKGDVIDVIVDKGLEQPFSLVDMDICGRPTYREGSILSKLMHLGLVTKRACLRITFCLRGGKGNGSVRQDMDQLNADLRESANVLSYESHPYKNGKGVAMEVRQWVLEGRDR